MRIFLLGISTWFNDPEVIDTIDLELREKLFEGKVIFYQTMEQFFIGSVPSIIMIGK